MEDGLGRNERQAQARARAARVGQTLHGYHALDATAKTRLSKRAQFMRADACACSSACSLGFCAASGTIAARNVALGASTP